MLGFGLVRAMAARRVFQQLQGLQDFKVSVAKPDRKTRSSEEPRRAVERREASEMFQNPLLTGTRQHPQHRARGPSWKKPRCRKVLIVGMVGAGLGVSKVTHADCAKIDLGSDCLGSIGGLLGSLKKRSRTRSPAQILATSLSFFSNFGDCSTGAELLVRSQVQVDDPASKQN